MKLPSLLAPLAALLLGATTQAADLAEHPDWSLICAVLSNDAAAVKELLARGADPNAALDANQTVLAVAVRRGAPRDAPELARLLCEAGANPNARCANGRVSVEGRLGPEMMAVLTRAGFLPPREPAPEPPAPPATPSGPVNPLLRAIGPAIRDNDLGRLQDLLARGVAVNTPLGGGSTMLMKAVGGGKPEIIDFLLARGADARGRMADSSLADFSGHTALHVAVCAAPNPESIARSVRLTRALLEHGANPNARGFRERTVIWEVRAGAAEIVPLLQKAGADFTLTDELGETVLMDLAHDLHLAEPVREEKLRALLATGVFAARPDLVRNAMRLAWGANGTASHPNASAILGESLDGRPRRDTELMKAIDALDLPHAVELLAAVPAQIEACDAKGRTAVIRAMFVEGRLFPGTVVGESIGALEKLQLARLLIRQGADVRAEDDTGVTVLEWSTRGLGWLVPELLDRGAGRDVPFFGYTDLMLAALGNDPARAEALLARGAHWPLRSPRGDTAADLAANQSPAVFAVLRARGASPTPGLWEERMGKVPPHMVSGGLRQAARSPERLNGAAMAGSPDLVRKALAEGFKIDPARTLAHAIVPGHLEVAKLLLDRGAPANAPDAETPPLHAAVQLRSLDILDLLLARGASVNASNRRGLTALSYAVAFRNRAAVERLLKAGAEVNARSFDGMSPLTLARKLNDPEMIALLQKAGGRDREPATPPAAAATLLPAVATPGIPVSVPRPAETPRVAGTLLWRDAASAINSPPLLAPDGTLLYGSEGSGEQRIVALDAQGKELWGFREIRERAHPELFHPACVAPDGTIYAWHLDLLVAVAVRPARQVKWKLRVASPIVASPVLGADGTIYFGDTHGLFHAVRADGREAWQFATGRDEELGTAALGADGTVCFGTKAGRVFALTPAGEKKWGLDLGEGTSMESAPALAPDGTIHLAASQRLLDAVPRTRPDGVKIFPTVGRLLAVAPDGAKKWDLVVPWSLRTGNIAIGADGAVYLGAGGQILAFNPGGTARWSIKIDASEFDAAHLALGRDGLLYAGSRDTLSAITAEGAIAWSHTPEGHNYQSRVPRAISALTLGPDGVIYFTSGTGIYAYQGSAGPAETGWPMAQRDARRSGRAAR